MKGKKRGKKDRQVKKTHPKIIITALLALGFVALSFTVSPWFIIAAVLLWWINKKEIKKHFG